MIMLKQLRAVLAISLSVACSGSTQKLYVADPAPTVLHPGTLAHLGPAPFEVTSALSIRLVSAELVNVTPGLETVSIVALNGSENGGFSVGFGYGPVDARLKVHPVDSVALTKDNSEQWQLIATVRASAPGNYHVGGMKVVSMVNGHRDEETFPLDTDLAVQAP